MRRHWIKARDTELVVGFLAMGLGFVLLYDAYDGRGAKKPILVRPLLPF